MMAALDPPLHERVYTGLKAEYLAGAFRPGTRIDLQELADRHRSSKTPVREAAFIMVGEGLLTHHADGGFVVPALDVTDVTEMLAWHLQLVLAAVFALDDAAIRTVLQQSPGVDGLPTAVEVATLTGAFFTSLAGATGNALARVEVRRLNDRLHYYRIADCADAKMAHRELGILTHCGSMHIHKAMRRRLMAYHQRRIDRVRNLVRHGP